MSDRRIAALLGTVATAIVGFTSNSIGFTRDEGYYFKAAEDYFGWFRELWTQWGHLNLAAPFAKPVIDRYWSYNHEHPVLMKTLFGLSWGILKGVFGIFDLNSTAFRFPAFCMAGFSVALVYLLARQFLRRDTSIFAAVLWLSLPHPFWHMHLACFDIPVCAAHLWTVYAYARARESTKAGIIAGLAFGLAISVKHNVVVLPAFLVLHWILNERATLKRNASLLQLPEIPVSLIAMALLGPLVLVAHWPYVWPDVIARIGGYYGYHLNHEHYPILYFGDLLTHPPFPHSFVYVMTAVTVPIAALTLMITGLVLAVVKLARPDSSQEGMTTWGASLLLLNVAFPFLLFLPSSTPIFGGTKHWMNALPFLCILGAWALQEGFTRLAEHKVLWARAAMVLAVIPGFWITARAHPYGLGAYNEVAGFARGAANIGFQRTFWGHEPRLILPLINERTRPNGSIHFGDTNYDDWRMYIRDGLLRRDIQFSQSVGGSAVACVQPQGEFKEQWMSVINDWGTQKPDAVVSIEGVPLVTVTFAK